MRTSALLLTAALAACSSQSSTSTSGSSGGVTSTTTSTTGAIGSGTTGSGSTSSASTSGTSSIGSSSTSGSSGSSGTIGSSPTAAQLLALTRNCTPASNGLYKTDADSPSSTISICKLNGAFFWSADMDVDCDGKTTTQCNLNTDPAYQNQTSLTDLNGDPLDAANLPYVVIPLPSTRFDYTDPANQLALGDVVAVIYDNQINYGVFGDEGPSNIIGEASYAMANSLGSIRIRRTAARTRA